MVLRRERNGGAALLSLPRDLWVPIAGTGKSRTINIGLQRGPASAWPPRSSQSLGIPIHHYVEIDFAGFKKLVDEIGGVEVCTYDAGPATCTPGSASTRAARRSTASQALAYARSRYYEEWTDGDWHEDPRADLGRIERQQLFIREAVDGLLHGDRDRRRSRPATDRQAVADVGAGSTRASTRSRPPQALRQAAEVGPAHVRAARSSTTRVGDAVGARASATAADSRSSPTSAATARRRRSSRRRPTDRRRADARCRLTAPL